ncbi:MAG: preprotein translocase subunit SecE [Bdellovibrionales bacterium]
MTKVMEFFGEVKREIAKVTWPTRGETVKATIMVLVMAVIAAIFFFVVDKVVAAGIRLIVS